MTRTPSFAAAAALLLAAAAAPAQVTLPPPTPVVIRTLVTPALIAGNKYYCNVTNMSSQALTLGRLDLYGSGQVLAYASCSGGSSVAPGGSCGVTWELTTPSTWGIPVHCRAQHTGAESALVGSLQAFLLANGENRAVASAAMQPIPGITLAP